MKKTWKRPLFFTLTSDKLSDYVKVAASSGCDFFVGR